MHAAYTGICHSQSLIPLCEVSLDVRVLLTYFWWRSILNARLAQQLFQRPFYMLSLKLFCQLGSQHNRKQKATHEALIFIQHQSSPLSLFSAPLSPHYSPSIPPNPTFTRCPLSPPDGVVPLQPDAASIIILSCMSKLLWFRMLGHDGRTQNRACANMPSWTTTHI